jgi:hypothetical protein
MAKCGKPLRAIARTGQRWVSVGGRKVWTWWHPQSRWRKAIVFLVLLAPIGFVYSRKEKEPPFELKIQQPGAVPYDIYLVDVSEAGSNQEDGPREARRLSQASLLQPFGVVIRFYNLTPGRAYQVICQLEDDDGNTMKADAPKNIQSNTNEGLAYFPFSPDVKTHAAGDWKAKLSISGVGVVEYEFEVEGPTREEKRALSDNEEAVHQAVRAFAHFWVVSPYRSQRTYITATSEVDTKDIFKRYKLYQVAGLDVSLKQGYISPADRLNGITYLGSVGFGFSEYRSYDPESGWTEWSNASWQESGLRASLDRLAGPKASDPDSSQQGPGMRFDIECRDGEWWVRSKEGADFVNGIRNPKTKGSESQGSGSIFDGKIFQPRIEYVMQISEEGVSKSSQLKQLADEIAASGETLKEQQKLTIKSIVD